MFQLIEITESEVPSNNENLSMIESIQKVDDNLTNLWVSGDAPNFEYLTKMFGRTMVPVYDCQAKYYNSQFKKKMKMEDFMEYWVKYKEKDYIADMPLLYLKDWHCSQEFKHVKFYEVPYYFASDWLNEYFIAKQELNDDYMFVYMGPKGTWTPLHKDVFQSYSWSANIVGRKRWLFIPPKEEEQFYDVHGNLVYDVFSDDLKNRKLYKNYDEKNVKYIEVIQEPGEIMFVPSGWHHQVWNLEDTISINHNWINGCNINIMWLHLKTSLISIMKEVDDVKDMDDWPKHCQLLLEINHGMFDKIKTGLRYANDYLNIVKDVTNLVSKSFNSNDKRYTSKRGDPEEQEQEEPDKNQDFRPTNLISAFFRLFGLDTQKIAAIAVNSVIFLAQMISSLFDLPPVKTDKVDRSIEDESNDETIPPWDPLKFILENKNDKMRLLLDEARNEALTDKLMDTIDGFDSPCIRLLLCKTSIVIKFVQQSLKNKKSNGIGSFTAWFPSKEDFERNSDECEDKYTDCRLFPES
ncbi:PREDICTED: jmjC domain-containing protein 4 isoform X2 [Polistes dominula]|uniref:Jumonji domain-containing protein 4 n=1 Tax=Polistes dominula TaxID=743375 RepID=A0ABM1IQ65_POLDO|nr:PREDICTED: jmjC domain-containing protein 4 isoform X2 [Polistes dominula]